MCASYRKRNVNLLDKLTSETQQYSNYDFEKTVVAIFHFMR